MMNDMAQAMESKFYGKYRGMVDDNNDPTGRGRLSVCVPAVMGEQCIWALPCVPYAGDNAGFYMIPEPGTLVWVEFEAGDPSYPIWTGCLWPDDQPPKNNASQAAKPAVKIIRSKEGLMVSMDDEGQVLHVSDKNGKNVLSIEVNKGTIKIKGATKAIVEAPQIELVENATHPVVFGDQLMAYLNQIVQLYQTHTHPGQLAIGVLPVTPMPPLPPMPPPTTSLLSNKVKTG